MTRQRRNSSFWNQIAIMLNVGFITLLNIYNCACILKTFTNKETVTSSLMNNLWKFWKDTKMDLTNNRYTTHDLWRESYHKCYYVIRESDFWIYFLTACKLHSTRLKSEKVQFRKVEKVGLAFEVINVQPLVCILFVALFFHF